LDGRRPEYPTRQYGVQGMRALSDKAVATQSCQVCARAVTAAARLRICTPDPMYWFQIQFMKLRFRREVRDVKNTSLHAPTALFPVISALLSVMGASSSECPIALKISTNM
jgi:hypothetical protein